MKCFRYYRPQRIWPKVMFLQVCVILFTGGSASVHAGIVPPGARQPPPLPGKQTPVRILLECILLYLCFLYLIYIYRLQQSLKKDNISTGVCPEGEACAFQGAMHSRGACVAGGGFMRNGQTATEAGGTHPTGMHCCNITITVY